MFHKKMINQKPDVLLTAIFFLISLVGGLMVVIRVLYSGHIRYAFLIWNLFLAWVPYGIAVVVRRMYRRREGSRKILWLLGGIWLFFYPNAPYIITDFIHLTVKPYFAFESYVGCVMNEDFMIWYDFIMIALFSWLGFLLGFVSLYAMQQIIAVRYNRVWSWGLVIIVSFLSGFGIYLGRFIRWNSWDVLFNPLSLLRSVLGNLHLQSLAFSVLFGGFLLLIYLALYGMIYSFSLQTAQSSKDSTL